MDVYTADGQLKGTLNLPLPSGNIYPSPTGSCGQQFDPDFVVSGAQALWFIDKELNIKPDGVIGLIYI